MKVIVALSFGAGPVPANYAISLVVEKLYDCAPANEKPILILQEEIAENLKECLERWHVIHEVVKKDGYIGTYEVLTKAKETMEERGVDSAILVAHPAYYPRVEATAKKLGFKLERPSKGDLMYIPYNAIDLQRWTNSPLKWWAREVPARLLYFLKRYIRFRDIFRCSL